MPSRRRFRVILLAVAVLAIGGCAAYVSRQSFRDGLRLWSARVLSGALRRQVAIGGASYRFPLTIVVADIAVASRDSIDNGCLARIAELRVGVDPLRSLWHRRITVGVVNVSGASIELQQYRDGTWNFSGLLAPTEDAGSKGSGGGFPPLSLPAIAVRDLSLTVRRPSAVELIDSVELRMGLRMGGRRLRADIREFRASDRTRGLSISRLTGRLTVSGDTIRAENVQLMAGHSTAELTAWLERSGGRMELSDCRVAIDLRDVAALARSGQRDGWEGTARFEAAASGTLAAPRGRLSIAANACRAGGVSVDGIAGLVTVSGDSAAVESLAVWSGGGRISATAGLDRRLKRYAGKVTARRVDLGRLMPQARTAISSNLNAALEFRGRGFDLDDMSAVARVTMSGSSVNDIPITRLDASIQAGSGEIAIERFLLTSGQASLGIRGDVYKDAVSLELETDEIELAQFGPLFGLKRLSGKLRLTGLLSGPLRNPDVIGTFRLKEAILSEYACRYFDGTLSIKSIGTRPSGDGKFTASEISIGKHTIDRVEVLTELRGTDWGGISVVVEKDSITQAKIVGLAEIDGKDIKVNIAKLYYQSGDQMVVNSQPINADIRRGGVALRPTELLAARGRLRLEGEYRPDRTFSVAVRGRDLDGRRLVALAGLDKTVHGTIDFDFSASGPLADPAIDLSLDVSQLRYEQFTADGLELRAGYRDRNARLERLAIVRYGQESEITAEVGVDLGVGPGFGTLQDRPLTAEVVLRDIGTWVFLPMADLLSVYEGRVDVNVKAAGTPSKPLLSGSLTINQAKMVLRPLGMYLHNVQAAAHFNADSVVVDNVSGLTEGQGTIQLGGHLLLEKFIPTRMRFDVVTQRSPIRNIPFIEANVNSQITIGGSMDYIRIGGRAQVNSALISLPFAPAEEPPPPEGAQKPMDLDLAITGPNGIWLRNSDADIELKIDNLNVRMSQNLLFLSGRLEPLRGVYRFMDRTFDITEGYLSFTNAAVINPDLNLRAQATIFGSANAEETSGQQRVEVYLTITGNALMPKLSFRSEPPMDERDILSMVGAGVRVDEITEMDIKGQVFSRGADYLAGMLAGRIQKDTGLDMLKFKTKAGAESKPQVTLGKYVTPDVFVSYSQGFSSSLSNEFKAEYLFGTRSAVFAQKDEKGKYNLGLRMKFKY